jgi:hypothetical protein
MASTRRIMSINVNIMADKMCKQVLHKLLVVSTIKNIQFYHHPTNNSSCQSHIHFSNQSLISRQARVGLDRSPVSPGRYVSAADLRRPHQQHSSDQPSPAIPLSPSEAKLAPASALPYDIPLIAKAKGKRQTELARHVVLLRDSRRYRRCPRRHR